MASVYDLKPKFQNLLRPIAKRLAKHGITANQVTAAACVLSIWTGVWMVLTQCNQASLIALPIVLFVRMALNAIDGMLAREHGMASKLGAVLNELCDVISDSFLFSGFFMLQGVWFWLLLNVIVLAVLTEYQGVLAQALSGKRAYQGPMGKSDRAFLLGVVSIGLALEMPVLWANVAFSVAGILLVRTLFNRVRAAL